MHRARILIAAAVVVAAVGLAPVHATGVMLCDYAATLTFYNNENLLLVNGGGGTISGLTGGRLPWGVKADLDRGAIR